MSIDYRLAPAYPFPCGLEDVWQVYNWAITRAEEEIGFLPQKVFLAGDSAGGNLILGLACMAIEKGIRLPDGILMQ